MISLRRPIPPSPTSPPPRFRRPTLTTGRHVVFWWLVTRLIVLALWAAFGLHSQGDVTYYWQNINALFHGQTPDQVFPEYPTPLILVLSLPYVLGFGHLRGFQIAFITLFVLTDAFMTLVFWRTARRFGTSPEPTVGFWIIFLPAIGPISYMRLDLLTAALSAAALITLVRRHRATSGTMIGLGAAIKLWPALLWPAVLVDRRAVRRATVSFLVTGATLAVASWLYAGSERLVSPLRWQSDRGLQVESVWATPALLARLIKPSAYDVSLSSYNAFEVAGPGSAGLITASTVATIVGGLIMVVLYVGWLRRADRTPIEAGTLMVLATLIMIVTNKTFSPQYMIWLGGPVAGLLTISARHPEQHLAGSSAQTPLSLARKIAAWVLGLTVLTQLIYPVTYGWLVHWHAGLTWVATAVLASRNVLVVYLTVRLVILAARSIAGVRPTPPVTPPAAGQPVAGPPAAGSVGRSGAPH